MIEKLNNLSHYGEYFERITDNNNNKIFVLKGFGDYSFNKHNSLLNIDLNNLENEDINKKEIGNHILDKIRTGISYILSYEEFLLTSDIIINFLEIFGEYEIIIINNNIFNNYYPLSSTINFSNIKRVIDKGIDSIYLSIYDDYYLLNDMIFVSYQSFEKIHSPFVKYIDFYKKSDFEPEISNNSQVNIPTIQVSKTEEGFLENIATLINCDSKTFNINLDVKGLTEFQKNIVGIFFEFGYHFTFVNNEIQETEIHNISEYLNILKRKNSFYEFRDINFYKNPGFSLDTVKVSQATIINDLVNNSLMAKNNANYNDIFVTAPTGSGKSILFQIPAIYLAENYNLLTIVITPLIGLMNDQVQNIQQMTETACTLNSEFTPAQKEEIKQLIQQKEKSILYISPETLLSNNPIDNLIGDREIGLMIIDESHIVSTWGKSFRPDYWFLGDYISKLRTKEGRKFPIATFSATVTFGGNDDMHADIIDSLKMKTGKYEYIAPMRRDDIHFDINVHSDYSDYLQEKELIVLNSLNKYQEKNIKTIAYFPFTKQVNTFHSRLPLFKKAGKYHGALMKIEKEEAANNFKSNQYNLILATKAFGMGIDIDDVEVVYHYAPTGNLCDYVQEIGRAARRKDIIGTAKTDFFEQDYRYIKQLFGMSAIRTYQIKEVLRKLKTIYETKNNRNFTISPDEFSYIFPNSARFENADNSFKTIMLMIQKDFEKNPTINFKPVVFRPRSMFTKGYFMIKECDFKKLRNHKNRKYFSLYSKGKDMASKFVSKDIRSYLNTKTHQINTYTSEVETSISYLGDIYLVDFKKMWEDNYHDLSFAEFKHHFYTGQLEDMKFSSEFIPEYLLSLTTNKQSFSNAIDVLTEIFDYIIEYFSKQNVEGSHFSLDDIEDLIHNCPTINLNIYESKIAAESFIVLLNKYQVNTNFNAEKIFKLNYATNKYSISSISLLKKRLNYILKDCKRLFEKVYMGQNRIFLLSLKQKNGVENCKEIIISQLFEMFKLGTYQVLSGERPEYFIRINSVSAIEKILENNNYESQMVKLVKTRHELSMKIMTKFFTELSTDKERWDFVEKYFAGFDETDLLS